MGEHVVNGYPPEFFSSSDSEDELRLAGFVTNTPGYKCRYPDEPRSGPSARWPKDDPIQESGPSCLNDERIKIVPSLGWHAGIEERDFDISLDDTIANWFEGFKDSFRTFKKGPIISQRLQMFYLSTQNPFEWALKLYANCPDYNTPKGNSLAYTVMEELNNFKKRNHLDVAKLVDDNLRMVAFNFVAKQGQTILFRMVVEIFDLLQRRELFVPPIRKMIEQKHFKEAGQIATDLELFDEFSEHDFVMPLFLQDKISIAEDYLNKAVRLQRPVVKLLDSFLDKKGTVETLSAAYISNHGVVDVYYSKLHQKPLSKLVQRLAKNYDIPKELTPNMVKMKNFGTVQFLINKRYYDKSLNKESFEEMICDTVSEDDRELHRELVYACSFCSDFAGAAKWAERYNISFHELPLLLQEYITGGNGGGPNAGASSKDDIWGPAPDTEPVHSLSLDESRIQLVDTKDKFNFMISDLSRQGKIAFDAEWKPTFGGSNDVSLIQLATKQNIYLIDVIATQIGGSDWAGLAKNVFNQDDILKLAFAPATDISMFQKALPSFNVVYNSQTTSGILDLQELWRHISDIEDFHFPYEEEVSNKNLSSLAKLCLGKKLDKSNQFSNWAQRPLRKEQLIYAALDAYCLLEIYEVIEAQLTKLKIDCSDILNTLLGDNKNSEWIKKRSSRKAESEGHMSMRGAPRRNGGGGRNRDRHNKRRFNEGFTRGQYHSNRSKPDTQRHNHPHPGRNENSVLVSDVRFVCDRMLEGLAKMLRRFGIDATILSPGDYSDRCVFKAMLEDRFVLTRGSNYYKFVEYLPAGHCYKVGNDRLEDQLLEVLKYYKIVIQQKNIFSRCQLCNGGVYLSATPDDVYFLRYQTDMPAGFRKQPKDCSTDKVQRIKLDRSCIQDSLQLEQKLNATTSSGVRIDTSYVGDTVLASVEAFYICDGCGRCYWDGSHLDNVLAGKLANLLTLRYE